MRKNKNIQENANDIKSCRCITVGVKKLLIGRSVGEGVRLPADIKKCIFFTKAEIEDLEEGSSNVEFPQIYDM